MNDEIRFTVIEKKFVFPKPDNITKFSEFCGVTRTTAYNWLNGKTVPKEKQQAKIREWFEKLNYGKECQSSQE